MSTLTVSDLSIVLIEPSVAQLKFILKHLRKEGITHIKGVKSGQEALAILKSYQPDLIISSMYLPDMTASELVAQVKAAEEFNHIQFMLISSETNYMALEPIKQAGVVAILPKPFDHADLKRALRATIEFVEPDELELECYDVGSIRVLLVDDSAFSRKQISQVLTNMGIQFITMAENGKDAIDIFRRENEAFDLIVTDYNMPEMDGKELIETIRRQMDNCFVPILMVTSEANETRLSHVQQAGVSAICNKPFQPKHVKELLYRLLDNA